MDIKQLEKIVSDWSFWDKAIPESIPRTVHHFPRNLSSDLVTVIQGVRRSGKSTFLTQLLARLGIPNRQSTFINFEDPRLTNQLSDTAILDQILAVARAIAEDPSEPTYLFLDEIQNVANWEKWLHLQTAHPTNMHFVVTGSNSRLLSGDLSTALAGRHVTSEIFPFDFKEYRAAVSRTLTEYLSQGGFPRTLTYDPPDRLLREYFTDIVEKDVRRHVAARSTQTLQQLFQIIFESVGSEVSLRGLAKTLDITADTVSQYVGAGQGAYLIMSVPFFAQSERKRLVRNKKFYAIDTGLRNSIVTRTGEDIGKNFENLVFLTLRRQTREIFYWRGQGEIDFVVRTPHGFLPIQVSWTEPKARHKDAVQEFRKEHRNALDAVFVSEDSYQEFVEFLAGIFSPRHG